MAHIAFENVSFTYPGAVRPALAGVSFEVAAGEFVLVCGRSGCGKTTLLRHLKPAIAPYGERVGNVLLDGVPVSKLSPYDQAARVGFVMQDPDAQIVTEKVWHELAFGLESIGCDQAEMRVRIAEMASYFGIQSWFYRDVNELSGGQKQLLNLASVMAMQPDVLVLDEPTSQLDPIAASNFLNTVRKINQELGITVVMTEHRLEEAYALADKVAVLEAGRLASFETPRGLAVQLAEANDPMSCALPAPLRVACGVDAGDEAYVSRSAGIVLAFNAEDGAPASNELPMTVREGRAWLAKRAARNGVVRAASSESPAKAPVGVPQESAVRLREVWFRYDRKASDVLRGASLEIPRGSLFAIVGGNGVGKSTLLKAMCGIVKPYRGKVFADGAIMLPQDPLNVFAHKTVREDLAEMLRPAKGEKGEKALRGDGGEAIRGIAAIRADEVICGDGEAIRGIAAEFEIEHLLDSHPYDLSGGEVQRAALAKAMLGNPRVLLLDEPTKGMDAIFKKKLIDMLRNLTKRGVTVVMVSHDVEFCAQAVDFVAMMFDGEVTAVGTPREVFSSNAFYTTAVSRMSRGIVDGAVVVEDLVGMLTSDAVEERL